MVAPVSRADDETGGGAMPQAVIAQPFDDRRNVMVQRCDDSMGEGRILACRRAGPKPGGRVRRSVDGIRLQVTLARIAGVFFRGRDTAPGTSWALWVQKYHEKKCRRPAIIKRDTG